MVAAARRELWDERLGRFVSGESRQISWASQAWLALAGVPTPEDARALWPRRQAHPAARQPVTPYLHHQVVEAMWRSGLREEALEYLERYWGGMMDCGADTSWEVWVPTKERESPYRSHLMNTYCTAWSCTPSWFLRAPPPAAP